MFKYIVMAIWCVLGIVGLFFRKRNKVLIVGEAKARKRVKITYITIATVLCFMLFMNISINGFNDIQIIVSLILAIIVINVILMGKDGITEEGLLIIFKKVLWKDIIACSMKRENTRLVLYYTNNKSVGELKFRIEHENEIRKILKKKRVSVKL